MEKSILTSIGATLFMTAEKHSVRITFYCMVCFSEVRVQFKMHIICWSSCGLAELDNEGKKDAIFSKVAYMYNISSYSGISPFRLSISADARLSIKKLFLYNEAFFQQCRQ